MAKTKLEDVPIAGLRAPALAMKLFHREMEKTIAGEENGGSALARSDAAHLSGIHAYTLMLFFFEFAQTDLDEKHYRALLKKYGVDTPANLKIYPRLSQSALFEICGSMDVSRESIRRLLISLSEHELIDRVSKGPPFPDELELSRKGRKLMTRLARKIGKEAEKEKPFAYL